MLSNYLPKCCKSVLALIKLSATDLLLEIDRPTVKVTMPVDAPLMIVDTYVSMACVADGIPVPVVYWKWQKCSELGCQPLEADWKKHSASKNIPHDYRHEGTKTQFQVRFLYGPVMSLLG